jgi:hypothetical protein
MRLAAFRELAMAVYSDTGEYQIPGTNGLAIRKSASKPGDACLLASGWGSNGGTLGEQQSFRQLSIANATNVLTCCFSD